MGGLLGSTVLLSKVIGIVLLVVGVAMLLRKDYWKNVIAKEFASNNLLRFFLALIEMTAGLFIILQHNLWGSLAAGIVSFMGWAMAIEGATYLFLSNSAINRILKIFNRDAWYLFGSVLGLIAGAYLVATGFGFI